MKHEILLEKIKQRLQSFDKEQIKNIAWQCAVYALPYLTQEDNFNCWKKDVRQKYIYSIFLALDISASKNNILTNKHIDNAINSASTADAFAVSDACFFAASNSASEVQLTAAAITATIQRIQALRSTILLELNIIQKPNPKDLNEINNLYQKKWKNFQIALQKEGCEYWGKLYKNILDNGFELDKIALERRTNIPNEIGDLGASSVASYLEDLEEEGGKRLNEARIIILGDKGTGKTCLARRLVDPSAPMTTENESTAGVDTMLWELENENINIRIWDFAGHTVTHAVHQFFLSERSLYIILYDGRTEDRNRLEYWLNHMKNYGKDSSAIILVNKRDQHSVDIQINSLREKFPISGFYTFSIKDDGADLENFRSTVCDYIKNNPSWNKQEIPINNYRVKEELEQLFSKCTKGNGVEHITLNQFEKIARRNNVINDKELLTRLHALGVSLWYKNMEEFDTLVLNPEWISHGVYKIINWVNEEKKHTISLEEFALVFEDGNNRFPKNKYSYLFKLMKKYELAYETSKGKCLIIPHLLKIDRPDLLPDFPLGESLMLRYKADHPLPPNTISRFIVRHNQEIKRSHGKNYLVWRYGVVIERNNNIALIREDDRNINVLVKGPEKTDYLSKIRDTLNDIFNSYRSEKPILQFRIERQGELPINIEKKSPLWLSSEKILNHFNEGVPYYEDTSNQYIYFNYVVNNYNINSENSFIGGYEHQVVQNTFNFHDCNINLQGSLNELAQSLKRVSNVEDALELESTAKMLELVEKAKNRTDIKKKGIPNRLKRILDELSDEDSKLHKSVKNIKHGISIAQDIAKGYNSIAQWLGLPQVPKPFLK